MSTYNIRQFAERIGVFARTLQRWEGIAEIGGGLNFKRPKLLNLVDRIVADQVGTLIIAHQDRLSRFGYDLVTHLCTSINAKS